MSATDSATYKQLINLLGAAQAAGDLATVDRVHSELLKVNPDDANLLSLRIALYNDLKKWRQATKAYDRLLSLSPSAEQDALDYKKTRGGEDWSPFAVYTERNRLYAVVIILATSSAASFAFLYSAASAAAALLLSLGFILLCESAYRAYLYLRLGMRGERHAYPVNLTPPGFFPAADKDEQEFDPVRGFNLRPFSKFVRVGLQNGLVIETHTASADANGNVGFTDENFEEDTVNVIVLGDSYTNFPGNGATQDDLEGVEWPYFFRRALHRNGCANIRIMNYARSGHGILQMADTGAQLVEQYKNVDVVIIAFIVRDLNRYRYWHMSYLSGGARRSCRTQSADPRTPLFHAADQDIIDDRIDLAWAKARREKQDSDSLTADLTRRYKDLRRRNSARAVDLTSWQRLYVLDRIFFGTPFIDLFMTPRVVWKKDYDLSDYATDPKFLDAIDRIKKSGARIIPVLLPIKEDLMAREITIGGENERKLLKSLRAVVGAPIHLLLGRINVEPAVVEAKYSRYPHDAHPSAWAMKLFGDALAGSVLTGQFGDTFTAKRQRQAAS